MYHRKEVIDMFSTFLQLEGDRFSKWLIDIKLRRSMQRCLEFSPEFSKEENFWVVYWYKHWQCEGATSLELSQSNPLCAAHLLAYLQEACYWASQKTVAKFANSQYSLADYFQMANAEVERVLQNFDLRRSSSLNAYAIIKIQSRLRDILRQRKHADMCSNWSLLRKVSKKILLEALDNAGLSESTIAQYRLAWNCFKEIYVQSQPGSTRLLPAPTPQEWEAIANLYNNSRHQLTQPTSECKAQTIEKWLNQSVIYLRTYLFPPLKSLDSFQQNYHTNQTQTLDIPDPSSDSLIADMIAQEDIQNRQDRIYQMFGVLSEAVQALDVRSQELFKLYYQQDMTQQQIIEHLQISQPTVSRKLVKIREHLLGALVKWSQNLNISVNPNQIKDMSIALEEWLRNQAHDININ